MRLRADHAKMTLELAPSVGDAPSIKPPPREFRIFAKGVFKSLNVAGNRDEFLFDEESADLVMAKAARKGTDYVIDYEHESVNTPGRAPAAGYFKLALRNGELWATDVEWTEQGASDLTSGRDRFGRRTPPQYRYFSPVFSFDQKTGRVTSLVNLGLTNMPATRDMTALAASHRPHPLPGAAPQHSTRITPSIAPRGVRKAPPMSKSDLARAAQAEAFETLKQAHADALATLKEANVSLSASNEELRAQLAEAKTTASSHQAAIKAKDEEIGILKAQAKDVAGIVGKDTLGDAKGAFAALKQEAAAAVAKAAELTAKFDKLESDAKVAKLTQLVDKGVADGKITPAEREHFLRADVSFVETIIAVRPAVVKMNETPQGQPIAPGPQLDLDPELVAVMKAMGQDPTKVAASLRAGGVPVVA